MESGVHGVESEADVCPGRRISGVSGSRWTSCGAGTGSADTLAGVADLTIPGEAPQSLPEGLLGHSTEHNQALASPAGRLRRSPGLAHFIPRTPDSDRLLGKGKFGALDGGARRQLRQRHRSCACRNDGITRVRWMNSGSSTRKTNPAACMAAANRCGSSGSSLTVTSTSALKRGTPCLTRVLTTARA